MSASSAAIRSARLICIAAAASGPAGRGPRPHIHRYPGAAAGAGKGDQWAPYDVPAAMRAHAIATFRHAIALDLNCDGKSTRSYPDSVIQIYGQPYRSRRGDVLIAMRPDPRRNRCEGPAGDEWQSEWFHMRNDNFRWIGNRLTLLDIGDYNGDGVAKILFQSDGYDRDGYLLLDLRDDSKTEFSWSYQ
jgi:hypothetical protein